MSEPRGVWRVAAHAAAALAFVATVIAAFWAAQAINQERLLWIILPLVVVYGLIRTFGTRLVDALRVASKRIRGYEQMSRAAAEALTEAQDLRAKVARHTADLDDAVAGGRAQGREQAVGELMGAAAMAVLEPIACVVEDGEFIMVARLTDGSLPAVGSRFFLRIQETKLKAALVVRDVAPPEGNVTLVIDEVWDRDFVHGMHEKARSTPEPPSGALIRARRLDHMTDLRREVSR